MIASQPNLSFEFVGNNKFLLQEINSLVKNIYIDYYSKFYSPVCVKKIYDTYQSPDAIEKAILQGDKYYIVKSNETNIGYIAVNINEKKKKVFLSKFYLDSKVRGQGIGKRIMDIIKNTSKKMSLKNLELYVYKNNPSVNIYEKMGFKVLKNFSKYLGKATREDYYLMGTKLD